jgi:ribosomal protein L37AE/L43A
MTQTLPATQQEGPVVAVQERALSLVDVRNQVNLIQEIMQHVMKKDEHYGVIPGTGNKPTLLKAGAEKLLLTFRLDPQYDVTEKYDADHLSVTSRCTLYHIPTGQRFGSGMGSCSTKESKYAYRSAQRKCPSCGKEAIIQGKKEYGGGWLCFAKKGGCGAKFKDGDKTIEGQEVGKVPNDNLPDQYNTIMKMANKRSLVAAVLNVTAASDIFTQDIEDMDLNGSAQEKPGTITPTTGALDALSAERQEVVMATAAAIRVCLAEDRPMDAYGLCEASGFDTGEKVALWSLLDSKARAALKRMAQAEKAATEGTISEPQKKRLEALIKEHKLDREQVKAYCRKAYNKEHFSELTPAEQADLEGTLKDLKEEQEAA